MRNAPGRPSAAPKRSATKRVSAARRSAASAAPSAGKRKTRRSTQAPTEPATPAPVKKDWSPAHRFLQLEMRALLRQLPTLLVGGGWDARGLVATVTELSRLEAATNEELLRGSAVFVPEAPEEFVATEDAEDPLASSARSSKKSSARSGKTSSKSSARSKVPSDRSQRDKPGPSPRNALSAQTSMQSARSGAAKGSEQASARSSALWSDGSARSLQRVAPSSKHEASLSQDGVGDVPEQVVLGKDSRGRDLLFWAAQSGYRPLVRLLTRCGAPVHGGDGTSPLLAAASRGDVAMALLLVAAQADVNAKDRFWVTPLLAACRRVDLSMARALLGQSADACLTDRTGRSPLLAVVMADPARGATQFAAWATAKDYFGNTGFFVESGFGSRQYQRPIGAMLQDPAVLKKVAARPAPHRRRSSPDLKLSDSAGFRTMSTYPTLTAFYSARGNNAAARPSSQDRGELGATLGTTFGSTFGSALGHATAASRQSGAFRLDLNSREADPRKAVVRIAELLIEHRANIHAGDRYNPSPLTVAERRVKMENRDHELLQVLRAEMEILL